MQVYNYDFKGYSFKVGTIGIKIKLICNIDINLRKQCYFIEDYNNTFIRVFKISYKSLKELKDIFENTDISYLNELIVSFNEELKRLEILYSINGSLHCINDKIKYMYKYIYKLNIRK